MIRRLRTNYILGQHARSWVGGWLVGHWMLPYRLRPPVYGGKLKQKRQQAGLTAADAIASYREGGPVERAVRADLLLIQPLFVDKLKSYARSVECQTQNVTEGKIFAIFKDVFGANRVALLHRPESSGLMVARCDRNAYSQMLYSICLSMIRETIRDHNASIKERNNGSKSSDKADADENLATLLQHCAFSLFTLYALYKTNTLPHGPTIGSSQHEYLSLLPLDLTDRQNSRMCYRRAFKAPIRIDPEQYGYLLQLRDFACLHQCRCKAAALQQQPWKYESALSIDVTAVLQRILSPSSNMLDFCAYTGPCGLEGLAGHADYEKIAGIRNFPAADPPLETAAATSVVQDRTISCGPFSYTDALHEQMEKYVADRSAIRLPAERPTMTLREKRIRSAVTPVFEKGVDYKQHKNDHLWNQLVAGLVGVNDDEEDPQKLLKRMRLGPNRVTFGAVVHHHKEVDLSDDASASASEMPVNDVSKFVADTSGHQNETNNSLPFYELVLPDNISRDERSTLRTIVKTLVERDQSLLLPTGSGLSQDDIPATGDAHSIANTTISNVGRCALQNLLSMAGRTKRQYATNHGSNSDKPIRAAMGDLFLSVSTSVDEFQEADNESSSALSDESSDFGEDSVAVSLVGQKSLKDLLSAAGQKSRGKPKRMPKKDDDSDKNSELSSDGEGDSDTTTERDASVGESMVGQRALQDLLSAAPTNRNRGKTMANLTRKAKSTKSKEQRSIESEPPSDDDSFCAEQTDASVAESRAGRLALHDLLSTARGGEKCQGDREGRLTQQSAKAIESSVAGVSHSGGNNSSGDDLVSDDTKKIPTKGASTEPKIVQHCERPSRGSTHFANANSSDRKRGNTKGKRRQSEHPMIPSRRSARRKKSQSSDSVGSNHDNHEHTLSEEESRADESRVGQNALHDLLGAVGVDGDKKNSTRGRKQAALKPAR